MPKQFGSQLDLQQIPLLNIVMQLMASPGPTSPVDGQLWYDTTNFIAKVRENGSWNPFVQTGLAPTGAAGGDLTGFYPSPTILANAVTTAKILDANVTLAKLAADTKDTAAGTASLRTLGTGAAQATAGNDARLSDARTPLGTISGDLAGSTYPALNIANLAVTAAKIANATITDTQVAAANKDGVAGTASLRTLGSGAQQAVSGTDARLSDARSPSGVISGDLAGSTYPALNVANLAITAAKVANATLTDTQVAAANKDGVVGTASMRTLGSGALQAMPGNRTLDAITAPAANVALNSKQITGLLDPTNPQDGATKNYVDSVAQGIDAKASVRLASTSGGGNLSLTGAATIDGTAVVTGDRVLVKDQTTPSQNGIYLANTAGAWTRATDMDVWGEVPGAFTFVEIGTVNADTGWISTADAGGTIGTTSITWAQFSAAGQISAGTGLTKTGNSIDVIAGDTSLTVAADSVAVNTAVIAARSYVDTQDAARVATGTQVVAGTGLTGGGDLSANRTLDVVGTANRISVASDSVDIAATYVGQTSITTLGTVATGTWNGTSIAVANGGTGATNAPAARTALGATGKFANVIGALVAGAETTLTHNLGTLDIVPSFRMAATNRGIELDWRAVDINTIGVTADIAYTASAVRVTVMG